MAVKFPIEQQGVVPGRGGNGKDGEKTTLDRGKAERGQFFRPERRQGQQ